MVEAEVILNFHGLGPPSGHVPDAERPYWITESQFEAVVDRALFHDKKRYRVVFTFDDGNRSDVDIGLPLLRRRCCHAKFFILAGRLEAPGYLNARDLVTLVQSGMTIGTHGFHHVRWPKSTQSQLETEFDGSIERLQSITAQPVRDVGVPFGAYDRRVLRELRKRPFAAIYTSDGGYAGLHDWIRPRTSLRVDTNEKFLDQLLTGTLPKLERLRQRVRVCRKSLL